MYLCIFQYTCKGTKIYLTVIPTLLTKTFIYVSYTSFSIRDIRSASIENC